MRIVSLIVLTVVMAFGQKPTIKIEGEDLLKALAYSESRIYTKLYDWKVGSAGMSPVLWDEDGNSWSEKGFERRGKVYIANHGKISHTLVGAVAKPGYWKLWMLGTKDKIIKATLVPNRATMEKPSIIIDKAFIKEEIVCEENSTNRETVYRIKFPSKVSFWMEEKRVVSTKGGMSSYTITYAEKPLCVKQNNTAGNGHAKVKLSDEDKQMIRLYLEGYYRAEENEFPGKVVNFFEGNIKRYHDLENVTKEDVLREQIKLRRTWSHRRFALKDMEIMDYRVSKTIGIYKINTVVDVNLTSENNGRQGLSYQIITLTESAGTLKIKAIKVISFLNTDKNNSEIAHVKSSNPISKQKHESNQYSTMGVTSGKSQENLKPYVDTKNADIGNSYARKIFSEWNSANNSHSTYKLGELYDNYFVYYGKTKSKEYAIKDKRRAFRKYPEFHQDIKRINISKEGYEQYRITFDKYVKARYTSATKIYPSYLVVKKSGERWSIIEEGDKVTDANLERGSRSMDSLQSRSLGLTPSYQNMGCGELWYARNKIFADSGYCFKGQKAISVFGRRCYSPYGRLSNGSKAEVDTIKYWERRRGCR